MPSHFYWLFYDDNNDNSNYMYIDISSRLQKFVSCLAEIKSLLTFIRAASSITLNVEEAYDLHPGSSLPNSFCALEKMFDSSSFNIFQVPHKS